MKEINLKNIPCFGIAGNIAGHLEQAGEAKDFVNIKTAEENAPKAIFPTHIPLVEQTEKVPAFLSVFPFSSEKIIFPSSAVGNLQIEPECGLVCSVKWDGDFLSDLHPEYFCASNDCSIRKEGARKISEKKNWGECSKGASSNLIPIEKFSPDGKISAYRIASYLIRDGEIFEYGENSAVKNYSYFYEKLLSWIVNKINTQIDEGPVEKIRDYLIASGRPEKIFISIGATRYTKFGETHFLQNGDSAVVVLYPETNYKASDIEEFLKRRDFSHKDISFLLQEVAL